MIIQGEAAHKSYNLFSHPDCLVKYISPADKWYILMEPGNKVQTFFLD